MIAMLFAAGLGTRMKQLTNNKPKALIEVNGKTLLEHNLTNLKRQGINEVVINLHHYAAQIEEFLKAKRNFGLNIILSHEKDLLLDTGGGLKKAKQLLKGHDYIILQNVDILSNIDLGELNNYHKKQQNMVTLAVRNRDTGRYLLFDNNNTLAGWKNIKTGETIYSGLQQKELSPYAFSGIQILSEQALDFFPEKEVFGLIEYYLNLSKHQKIGGYIHNADYWFDVGTQEKLNLSENYLKNQRD